MVRTIGWFVLILGVLAELAAIGFLVGLMLAPGAPRDDIAAWLCIGSAFLLGTTLTVGGILIIRKSSPIGVLVPTIKPGTLVGGYLSDQDDIRDYHGQAYKVRYTTEIRGKNPRPSSLAVSIVVGDLDTPCEGEFEIVPTTGFDRFGKRLGLANEVETGDEEFDDACYVRTDCPRFVESLLASDEVRQIIRDLFAMGFTEFRYAKHELTAFWLGFHPGVNDPAARDRLAAMQQSQEQAEPSELAEQPADTLTVPVNRANQSNLVEETVARLLTVREYWPMEQPVVDWASRLRRRTVEGLGMVFLFAYAALIFGFFTYRPMNGWEVALPGLLLVYPVTFAGTLLLTYLLLRGTSRSHYAWRRLASWAFFLTAIGSVGLVALLNGVLDNSPQVEHRELIVNKYTTRNRSSTTYHVECTSWRRPDQCEHFTTNSTIYNSVQPGRSIMVVQTRAGRFGIEWVEYQGIDVFNKQ